MQQASQLQQGGRLGPRFVRLLHHRQAALWFALLAVAGLAQFVSLFGLAFIVATFKQLGHNQERLSSTEVLICLVLSLVVALAATIYAYRTQKETFFEPPKNRIPRKRWRWVANKTGAAFAVPAAYATFLLWLLLLIGLETAARLTVSFPGLPGHPLLWLMPVPVGLALWAFVACRHATLEVLETAQPPELRLTAKLVQHVDEFADVLQGRARALERSMEEVTTIYKQVQQGIELEQQQLAEVREQYLQQARLKSLSDAEVSAVGVLFAQEQRRGARWGLWWNVVIAVVFLVVGLVMQALVDLDALGDQLRQWLRLG
jgi:hypothetical protein